MKFPLKYNLKDRLLPSSSLDSPFPFPLIHPDSQKNAKTCDILPPFAPFPIPPKGTEDSQKL